jgi:predicted alpha/beta hydrolase
MLKYESITVSMPSSEQMYLSRFFLDKKTLGTPVLMLHSTLQNSSTFYSRDGHGLAYYLAQKGYDVFVADLRGKGKKSPELNSASRFGSHQAINEDIPALLEQIIDKRGHVPQIWVGHGWGSVLMASFYARYGNDICVVARMVHFAARRKIQATNARKKFLIDFMWRKPGKWLTMFNGYMPAKLMRLGVTNESKANYYDYLQWSSNDEWLDNEDGFNYGEAILKQQLPPSFYFAASGDKVYGELPDVRGFINELGQHDRRLMVLSRQGGNLRNYGHTSMLLHKDADKDHFPVLLDWLK